MDLQFILALVGAAAWLPWLLDRLRPPRLYGKLISLTFDRDASFSTFDLAQQPVTLKGIGYLVKLSLTITAANLPVRTVRVFVKYPETQTLIEGNLYFTHQYTTTFDGAKHRLTVPSSQFVQFLNHFPKDAVVLAYAMFIVPRSTFDQFSYMEFRFYDWRDEEYSVTIRASDLDVKNIVFEDDVWRPV